MENTLVRARTLSDYVIAMRRAERAADEHAKDYGRKTWSREDADLAEKEMERQWRKIDELHGSSSQRDVRSAEGNS